MIGGVLHLNGDPVQLEPQSPFEEEYTRQGPQGQLPRCSNAPVGEGGTCLKDRFTETLPGGVTHSILSIQDGGRGDDTPEYFVPEGQFFVMGDNRDNSVDSRFPQSIGGVGFVPFENLLGRADRVIFSSAGQRMVYFWTWRADRFFEAIE
jgi:signal peptidase I